MPDYSDEQKINYLENDIAYRKSDINMMGKATMGDRMSPLDYSGNNMKLRSNINMMGDPNDMGQAQADLADMPLENIAGQGTEGINAAAMMKKGMNKATNY